jgi:hypothetical protein
MSKIIVTTDGVTDQEALYYALKVVNDGFVSNDNTQYCFLTTFKNGARVYADKTKSGTHTFRVWKTASPAF